jgi:hypothetical protein
MHKLGIDQRREEIIIEVMVSHKENQRIRGPNLEERRIDGIVISWVI